MQNFPQAKILLCNGVELEVFEAGQGRPLVLCHGWPEHAYSWRHQVQPLVDAGYHVIVPNQRGYGNSDCPTEIEAYDINHLCEDLTALLDHYGYDDAQFVGHDWGAIVTWNMALQLGPDFYIVHFNLQCFVADAVFDANTEQFLRNMYRTEQWREEPVELGKGMAMINLALAGQLPGTPI